MSNSSSGSTADTGVVASQKGQIDTLESVRNLHNCVYALGSGTPITMHCSPQMTFQVCPKGGYFYVLSFLFNIVKGVYSLPHSAPIELREYHHYSPSHSLTLKVPYAKTNTFYYSFFCDTLRHWNAFPQDIVDSSDGEHFKSKLSVHFRNMH